MLEQFPDGVWLVELAPLADPALVPQYRGRCAGSQGGAGRADHQNARCSSQRRSNCCWSWTTASIVLDAAARLVDAILRRCPNVSILVSSREALGIAGESAYRVPSLSLPEPETAAHAGQPVPV